MAFFFGGCQHSLSSLSFSYLLLEVWIILCLLFCFISEFWTEIMIEEEVIPLDSPPIRIQGDFFVLFFYIFLISKV